MYTLSAVINSEWPLNIILMKSKQTFRVSLEESVKRCHLRGTLKKLALLTGKNLALITEASHKRRGATPYPQKNASFFLRIKQKSRIERIYICKDIL